MKKMLKWILRLLMTPICLFLVLWAILYIPPVQQWAVRELATYASEQTNLSITFQRVDISPLFDLELDGLQVLEKGHTVIDVEQATVDLDFSGIWKGQIGIEGISLGKGKLDTRSLIPQTQVSGQMTRLYLHADRVNLKNREACLNTLEMQECNLSILIRDTTVVDTTDSAPIRWNIDVETIAVHDSRIRISIPGEDICVASTIRKATIEDGDINLEKGIYRTKWLELDADSLRYDRTDTPRAEEGMDYNHIALSNVQFRAANIAYRQEESLVATNIQQCSFGVKSGFQIDRFETHLVLDSTNIQLKGLHLSTPHSTVQGEMSMDWSALSPRQRGHADMDLKASLGKSDILYLSGNALPGELRAAYPPHPLLVRIQSEGNVDSLNITHGQVSMPKVFDIRTEGMIRHVTDSLRLGADLLWEVQTDDLSFLRNYLGISGLHFPPMNLTAKTQLRNNRKCYADALLREGAGSIKLMGKVDLQTLAYDAGMKIDEFQIHDFLPQDSIYKITALAKVKGRGTDLLDGRTMVEAQAEVQELGYGPWLLSNIDLSARLKEGTGMAEVTSDNELLKLQACADAHIQERKLSSSFFNLDMSHINLHALRLTSKELSASMVMHVEGASNLSDTHRMSGKIEAMELITSDSTYYPVNLSVDAQLDPQSILINALAGDLEIRVSSDQGIDSLMAKSNAFVHTLKNQMDSLYIQQDTLRTLLPHLAVQMKCGQRNPLNNVLGHVLGYGFDRLNFEIVSDAEKGINGNGYVHALNTGAVLLDTISWNIRHGEKGLHMNGKIRNGAKNKVAVFESEVNADITPTGANANLLFLDAKGKKGVDLGLQLNIQKDGIRAHFTPLNPIIAYRNFTLNDENFIELKRDGRLEALVDLVADDGTGMKLYSMKNEKAKQDLSMSVNRFNIGELSRVLPYMPAIEGLLHGDIHYMQADSTTTVSADLSVRNMIYEGTKMGNIGFNGVYFPNDDGSHYVDGIITQNEAEIVSLTGKYWQLKGDGHIDGNATLHRLPFSLADAFIPEKMFRLTGHAMGDLTVTGRTANPILTGDIQAEDMHIISDDYNVDLAVKKDRFAIKGSYITLDKIEAFAAGKSPLTLDGYIDFRNLDKIGLSVNMSAKNYQLINAASSKKSLAWGKVFVDMRGRLWGTLDNLKMRGGLTVLGNTDVSYMLKDSPITVDDHLADIVTFTDFSDTTKTVPVQTKNQTMDIQLNIDIEQAAQVHCILSEDGSDYINLQGGGNMTMTYDLQNELQLYGRYTILQGLMRYSLMAIPLNDFLIQSGSFVEFTGDIMNPRLNIKASERVKASVSENKVPRNVTFDVGLALSQTLEDMGLEFTLKAPEDMAVQNQLTAMSAEERGRVAVTMLVTGMYLTDDFNIKSGFSYANTLNTYLQSAINNIAGQAMGTVDVNFGIENSTTSTGTNTTDYSFSFAKRFWGNRINVIVGGKVSTGRDAVNTGQTIIDNVSIEYRLDKSATRYVRVYYDRNYESLLEGELTEMGTGLVLRKKTNKLRELFIFRKRKEKELTE